MSAEQSDRGHQAFQTMDLSGALPTVTEAPEQGTSSTEDNFARARKAGWAEPQKYDYRVYNASTREERDAVETTENPPAWASNAAKYEWSDEFGDVGPAHPELEHQLFQEGSGTQSGALFSR